MANLLDLPPELVIQVITESLPEGFESLALSCKAIHQLCKPFIEHHNLLRTQILLERIADEPIVARYIQHASFFSDGHPFASPVADPVCGSPIAALFADSFYLRDAGLDWREYHALIAADYAITAARPFSQHAAAFILTLLPNLKSLELPELWDPTDSSDKLLNTVVIKARQLNTAPQQQYSSSLAQIASLKSCVDWAHDPFRIRVLPFLALPKLRCYEGPTPEAVSTSSLGDVVFGEKLEIAWMLGYPIEEPAMADLLRSARRLRTFVYTPGRMRDIQNWDICRFLHMVDRAAGSRLERLSISSGSMMEPGHVSLRGFQRLQKLRLPLGFFECIISYAASRINKSVEDLTDSDIETLEVKLGDLIPASVPKLELCNVRRVSNHGKVLKVLFHGFSAMKASQLPALEKVVFLNLQEWMSPGCKSASEKLLSKNEPTGVVITIDDDSPSFYNAEWRGQLDYW
ncbi:hypothetical protein PG996_011014 [Apiospora saccharicola]|uniref:F-box domain-containing protein n=1 Tax=Apiospora saccharicola TaxID=335842 RepID=A0ABR1UDU2_9PEZI